MPKEEKLVDIDTSGEGAEINLEEKETTNETVVEDSGESNDSSAKPDEQPAVQDSEPKQETSEEKQEETKKEDDKLEEYSKGVQSRIAKLTRKMREAERQRDAATEYARS